MRYGDAAGPRSQPRLIWNAIGPGAMQTFAFIDTNVLLHYRFFRDVNWGERVVR